MFDEERPGQEGTVVMPGHSVLAMIEESAAMVPRHRDAEPFKIRLGPGLQQVHDERDGQEEDIRAVRLGRFCQQKGRRFWLLSRYDFYQPAVGDYVLGTVTVRTAENYKVDINGGMYQAVLGAMAFDGATRKNRPNLLVGSVVYARVSAATKHTEPELECTAADGGKNEEGFGEIKDGLMLRCTASYSQRYHEMCRSFRLQLAGHPLLAMLGKHFAFESIVGANGRLVIRTESQELASDLLEAIAMAENYTPEQMQELVLRPLLTKHKKPQ